jgi:biopolymer transport protein ExbD
MRSSRRALRELERNDLANKGEPPINLVPMIDVLTVLVLYLLVGTIFKQFTVLQLNLPGPSTSAPADQKPALQLTVILRKDRLEISDRGGTVRLLENTGPDFDLPALGRLLSDIKRRAGDEESITLLLEPDIKYDALVQVMDTVRVFPPGSAELTQGIPMFPAIAIGDAPKPGAKAK